MLIANAKMLGQYVPSEFVEEEDADTIFEYLCILIEEIMGDNEWWHVNLVGFGWRKTSGYKVFKAESAKQLLALILPNTDNSFKVYKGDAEGFAINNTHHDSPVWNVEWYTIRKATEDEIAECT